VYIQAASGSLAGGLNLRDAPGEVAPGEAIDLLNVTFTERGSVRQRDGYAALTASEITNQPDSVFPFYTSSGNKRLLVGNGNRIDALDTSGASQANVDPGSGTGPHYFVALGGPTAEAVYIANGTDRIHKFVVDTFSTPAGLANETGRFVAVTPISNRLVAARESGTTAGNNPSSVRFSATNAPEDFTADDFVDLDPGDGEAIMGLAVYGDQLFVFKETKFWVHYGESVDATGGAVFHFRKVDTGVGLAASRAVAVGPDGVYFLARDGIYRTTGGAPELISHAIEPLFTGGTSLYFRSDTINHSAITAAAATWHNEQFYVAVPTGSSSTNDRMLVFDPHPGWWTLYDIPAAALCRFRIGSQPELVFAAPAGSNYIYRHSDSYTSDDGTTISSRWRSGWDNVGTWDVKTIRETHVTGTGALQVRITKDWESAGGTPQSLELSVASDTWGDGAGPDTWGDGTDSSDTWGPSNTIRTKAVRYAVRGEVFSYEFRNALPDTTFAVHRYVPHLLPTRKATSTVATERT
jgi:hypothetical protein